jgi:hypothetical protein
MSNNQTSTIEITRPEAISVPGGVYLLLPLSTPEMSSTYSLPPATSARATATPPSCPRSPARSSTTSPAGYASTSLAT